MTESGGQLGVGDRLVEGPAIELIRSAFAREAADGALLHAGMCQSDLAHALALIESGIISPDCGSALLSALIEMNAIPAEAFPFDPANGDPYSNREHWLRQRAPDAAGWLQAGRARREVSTTAFHLVTRARLLDLTESHLELMRALLGQALNHADTFMPDYTYLQHAHATTLAHYLLGYVQPMTRDLSRLRSAFDRVNRSPAGGGSTNGSRLPLERERIAELLGFDGLVLHTRDAMWQPDLPVEITAALLALMVNVDRIAEDLQLWATAEFDFVRLSDRHSRVSVIMPHKKNPYSLTFVRGVAREMIGVVASTAAHQCTPSGQPDNRIFVYGTTPRALTQASLALRLLAATVADLTINRDAMAARAADPVLGATEVAEFIMMRCGIDARTAHRIVGRTVRTSPDSAFVFQVSRLDEASRAIAGQSLDLSDEQIKDLVQPESVVTSRTCPGGAGADSLRGMHAEFIRTVQEFQGWATACRERIRNAEERLMELAKGFVTAPV